MASVFVISVLDFWFAVPLGVAFDLPTAVVALTAGAGAVLGVLGAVVLGDRLRSWWRCRRDTPAEPSRRRERTQRIFDRYGAPGVGLLGPALVGSTAAAGLGAVIGVPRGRLVVWCVVGALTWTVIVTMAVVTGVHFLFH